MCLNTLVKDNIVAFECFHVVCLDCALRMTTFNYNDCPTCRTKTNVLRLGHLISQHPSQFDVLVVHKQDLPIYHHYYEQPLEQQSTRRRQRRCVIL